MKVKALLFDLGRVVIDIDFARVMTAWAHAARCDPVRLARDFDANVRGATWFGRHERGEMSDDEFFREVSGVLGLGLDEVAMRAGWNDIFVGEVPGINALLRQSAGRFDLYALSNTNPAHHDVFGVRFAEVLSHFRKLYLSHELGLRKPEPAIYRRVAADLRLSPHEILFFDDLAENVAAAEAVGMKAVLVRSPDDVAAAVKRLQA